MDKDSLITLEVTPDEAVGVFSRRYLRKKYNVWKMVLATAAAILPPLILAFTLGETLNTWLEGILVLLAVAPGLFLIIRLTNKAEKQAEKQLLELKGGDTG